MKQLNHFLLKNQLMNARKALFSNYLLLVLVFFGTLTINAQSTVEIPNPSNAAQKIIVYTDVPSHATDALLQIKPSDRYKIEVRLVGTTTWTPVFAHKTYNQNGVDFTTDLPRTDGATNPNTSIRNYVNFTAGWTHTYGNIEMTDNTPVEVKITKLDGTSIPQPIAVSKAAAHPSQKIVGDVDVISGGTGVVIFTINNPAQIVIDFDGAMDDNNKGLLSSAAQLTAPAVHTVSIFANPIMIRPLENASNVMLVEPGTVPSAALGAKTILYFKPGVHSLGLDFKLYPNKQYYIPGDAIVYGTFNNENLPTSNAAPRGRNIKVFGYGTISGARTIHHGYAPLVGGVPTNDLIYKSIDLDQCDNAIIEGITVVDPANHSIRLANNGLAFSANTPRKPITFAKWVKVISWRGNGDGIGNCHEVSDSFFRTNDDAGYIKGSKFRNIFWKDGNAAVFMMAGIPNADEFFPIKIEDCEVIYGRSRNLDGSSNSGVFHQRATAAAFQNNTEHTINLVVTNFKVSDKLSNVPVFNMFTQEFDNKGVLVQAGPSYKGIVFNNVVSESTITAVKQTVKGNAAAPFSLVTFNNCKINGKFMSLTDFNPVPFATLVFTPTSNLGIDGVKNNDSANNIKIYSNGNILNVNFPNADMSREIHIYNLLGQMVYKTTSQKTTTEIDARSLNLNGVVIVKVIAGDDVSSHKVLVQ